MIIILIGAAALLLYLLQRIVYKNKWEDNLKVEIAFKSHTLNEGDTGWLVETIENRKRLPLPMIKVKFGCDRNLRFSESGQTSVSDKYYRDEIFSVNPYKKIERELGFIASRRGFYSIDDLDFVGTDIFMSVQFVKSEKCHTECYVYPTALERDEVENIIRQLTGELLSKRRFIEDPFEYVGIREYQPFDEQKTINWKATAKTGELKVNTHGYTARCGVRIFLNLKDDAILKHEQNVENAIRLAVSLSESLLKSGNRVAVYANTYDVINNDVLSLPANTGASHQDAILKGLARLDTTKKHADFDKTFRSVIFEEKTDFMTIFISTPSANDFEPFVREYHDTGKDMHFFVISENTEPYVVSPDMSSFTTSIVLEKK